MKFVKWPVLAALLVGMIYVFGLAAGTAQAADPVTLKVYDPTGAFEITQSFAPRLDDLNGKTICELSNAAWQVERTFPLIESLLQKQFPTVKMVRFDQLPKLLIQQDVAGLEDAVKAKGCQAVIVGNAG